MTSECGDTTRCGSRCVLAVLESEEDQASLQRILPAGEWSLRFASCIAGAQAALHSVEFGIVICSARLGDRSGWKDVLRTAQRLASPPQVVVADRLCDQALWAEALNLGCYDLLQTPFESEVALRVLSLAWERWNGQQERSHVH